MRIGCDLLARQQTLAMLDTETGEAVTRTRSSARSPSFVCSVSCDTASLPVFRPPIQETTQIDAANRSGRSFKALPQLDLLAYLVDQSLGDVKSLGPAVDEDRNLVLSMQVLAVRTVAVRSSAGTLVLHKRAGQHFAEQPETAEHNSGPPLGV
jgi:hypothetical protein